MCGIRVSKLSMVVWRCALLALKYCAIDLVKVLGVEEGFPHSSDDRICLQCKRLNHRTTTDVENRLGTLRKKEDWHELRKWHSDVYTITCEIDR